MTIINNKAINIPALSILTLFICLSASADIYRYQDENGKWHFGDDKKRLEDVAKDEADIEEINIAGKINLSGAVTSRNVPVVMVPEELCPSDRGVKAVLRTGYWGKPGNFSVEKKKVGDKVDIYVTNNYFSPVSFQFWFEESRNMRSSKPLPLSSEISAHKSYKILTIEPEDASLGWRYSYNYRYKIGKLNPTHSDHCYYLPPVPSGSVYRVSQGFNGKFSHHGTYNQYAVDIGMPIGTDIVAARGGIIIERKTDFVLNGTDNKYKTQANVIRILHKDGTIATYAHLEFRTMKFKQGERVEAGQVIGRSGNTGYSTGPHLHFVVHANINMRLTSVPFKFLNKGEIVTPARKMLITNKPAIDNLN